MPTKQKRENIWGVTSPSSSFLKYFESHPEDTKYILEFETDVSRNPFSHPTPKKIRRIKKEKGRYPKGTHRWKKKALRIVYFPEKETHTVYPLDAANAGNAGYKKRR
ncbi:hypothetical protein KAS42_04215 [bacterium]|nr:hypothetical protein [bacterium]